MPKKKSVKFEIVSKLVKNSNQEPPPEIMNFRLRDEFEVSDIKEVVNLFFMAYGKKLREKGHQFLLASTDPEHNKASYFIDVWLYTYTWREL